jgi:uncharacterized protein (DUF983 family)
MEATGGGKYSAYKKGYKRCTCCGREYDAHVADIL